MPNNFFDAIGTVRMEAFVEQGKENGREERRREKEAKKHHRTRQGRKKDMSYWGVFGEVEGDVRWKKDDPFGGF